MQHSFTLVWLYCDINNKHDDKHKQFIIFIMKYNLQTQPIMCTMLHFSFVRYRHPLNMKAH